MKPFPITVVGASLGGLSALQTLLSKLPPGLKTAVIIVQHRRPDNESRLAGLLASHTPLPVSEVDDKQPILPGHVYLAPSNYHLLIEDGFFSLSIDEPVSFARPSIDVLFESAADAYGAAVIAVVLTGSSDDGARGAAAIKASGGKVLVQNPSTAESGTAPRAALEATKADAVLDLHELAHRIAELSDAYAAATAARVS